MLNPRCFTGSYRLDAALHRRAGQIITTSLVFQDYVFMYFVNPLFCTLTGILDHFVSFLCCLIIFCIYQGLIKRLEGRTTTLDIEILNVTRISFP